MSTVSSCPVVKRALEWPDIDLSDRQALRSLLRGDSIIDWGRLHLSTLELVDNFLSLNEFDPKSEVEIRRLEELRTTSVNYLQDIGMKIPTSVATEVSARDLLLIASHESDNQKWACVVLKVMHIINHLDARETMLALPVSDDAIFRGVELKVMSTVEQLQIAGHQVTEFAWSRKTRDSQITKLLAKRSTHAAQIYDRLRFRLIVPTKQDVTRLLAALSRFLLPFNYTVPDESVNSLIDLSSQLASFDELSLHPQEQAEKRLNVFSAPSYQVVNFVCDVPLRVESLDLQNFRKDIPSHIVFVQTEFQIVDEATAESNETGESKHSAYKERQLKEVRNRLTCESGCVAT